MLFSNRPEWHIHTESNIDLIIINPGLLLLSLWNPITCAVSKCCGEFSYNIDQVFAIYNSYILSFNFHSYFDDLQSFFSESLLEHVLIDTLASDEHYRPSAWLPCVITMSWWWYKIISEAWTTRTTGATTLTTLGKWSNSNDNNHHLHCYQETYHIANTT